MKLVILCLLIVTALAGDIGKFLQITDIHTDLRYDVGSEAHCWSGKTGLRCCRWYNIGIKPYRKAGEWGDYNCDTHINLAAAAISWIQREHSDLDFILWTGDSVDHHDITQSIPKNYAELNATTNLFKKYLPHIQNYPCLGNHDTYPIDQLGPPPDDDFITLFISDIWGEWILNNETKKTLLYGGYYTILFRPGWRLVALNSLYYDSHNMIFGKPTNKTAHQIEWLNETLYQAEQDKEVVWLIGHIYPGAGEALPFFDKEYVEIYNRYQKTIMYQFWGHSHRDEFFLLQKTDDATWNPTGMGWIPGSIMPDFHQPTVRIYYYNRSSLEILDYDQYLVNLDELNKQPDLPIDKVEFTHYYSAKESYGLPDMSYKSWAGLVDRMWKNDTLFQLYHTHYNPGYDHGPCEGWCKKVMLCGIGYLNATNQKICEVSH